MEVIPEAESTIIPFVVKDVSPVTVPLIVTSPTLVKLFLIVFIESKSMSDASGSKEGIRPAINIGVSAFFVFL